ncbi:MAG TPA: hypothetical protein VGH65_08110 [Verrucomicrobiaceae bacterium]
MIASFLLSVAGQLVPVRAGWEPLPPLPEPNGGFACGILNGGIAIAGGTKWVDDKKIWLDKIWWLDPHSLKWIAHGALPHALGYAVVGSWKEGVVIGGGFDGTRARSEVWLLDGEFKLHLLGHLKFPSCIALGGVCESHLIVVGGTIDPARLDKLSDRVQSVHLPDGVARDMVSPNDTARGTGASVASHESLFIFGGCRPDPVNEFSNIDEAWGLDITHTRWKALSPYPVRARGISAVQLDDHRIYLAGGYGGAADDFLDRGYIYDLKSGRYESGISLPQPNFTTLIVCGEYIYSIGGEPEKKMRTDKCWRIAIKELTAGK